MPDQLPLAFDSSPHLQPGAVPHLRDEIARVWGLPLGEQIAVTFRPAFRLASTAGRLELRTAPDLPWNPRQLLALRVGDCDFTNRDIDRWSLR